MADDNTPPKKGKLKLILVLVLLVVFAIGLSVAGTLWFMGAGIPGLGASNESPEEALEKDFEPSVYTLIEKALVTTVQAEDRQRYAQAYLALEATDQNTLDAASLHMPLLRSQLIGVLAARDFQQLQTPEGREQLVEQLLTAANAVLEQEGEAPLKRILLRNFVVQ